MHDQFAITSAKTSSYKFIHACNIMILKDYLYNAQILGKLITPQNSLGFGYETQGLFTELSTASVDKQI